MSRKLKYELVLDVLSDCHWGCDGCVVKKQSYNFSKENISKLNDSFKNLKDSGNRLGHLELGPVDFFHLERSDEVLGNINIIDLINNFEEIFITSMLVNLDVIPKLKKLIEIKEDLKLNIFVPINKKNTQDEEYLRKLKNSISTVKTFLQEYNLSLTVYPFLMGLDVSKLSIEDLSVIIKEFKLKTGLTLSLNNTCARVPHAFDKRRHLVYESLNKSAIMDEGLKLSFPLENESTNDAGHIKRGFLFNNDKLYFMPYLNQFINCIDESFVVESLSNFEEQLKQEQLLNIHLKESCMDCEHTKSCLDRGVLKLMDNLSQQKCILGRVKAL